MQTLLHPKKNEWTALSVRPMLNADELRARVQDILREVRERGDEALHEYTARFDGFSGKSLRVPEADFLAAEAQLSEALKAAIHLALENIKTFHEAQKEDFTPLQTQPGVQCWRRSVALEAVGLYVPGGTAPLLSTLLMLAVPARVAQCENIVVCTPTGEDGKVHPGILYIANLLNIRNVFRVGGAQAVAGMAFGTAEIPRVDKIFGPGNQYVTMAKQLVQENGVAIDMPAGPSEVLVIADAEANPTFVAADLLSQAEHGADSQVILLADDEKIIKAIQEEVQKQLAALPRKEIAEKALQNSRAIVLQNLEEALEFSNLYAPEHLILNTENAEQLAEKVRHAGSVFIGQWACESAGDYASGTNHTLPTNGYARSYSGVSLDSFVRKITFQSLSPEGIQHIGPAIEELAAAEQLQAHKNAVMVRLEALK